MVTFRSMKKQKGATIKPSRKRTYSRRGIGRLYIRTKDGKEHKPGSGYKGVYYLEYRLPTGETNPQTGKPKTTRKKIRLTLADRTPITKLEDAQKAQERIVSQYLAGEKKDRLLKLKAELEAVEQEHVQALEKASPPLAIADAWNAYESSPERPDSGEELLRRYCGYWGKFSEWARNKNPDLKYMRDITGLIAQDYAHHLNRLKLSPNTYNKHTCFLRLFFSTLKESTKTDTNPFEKIKSKKLKTDVRRELTVEELRTVLKSATGELQMLLCIGTFTGLRLGDCATLKWNEVDLDRGIVRRIPNKTRNHKTTPVVIGIPSILYNLLAETPKNKRKGYIIPKYAKLYTYHNKNGQQIRRSLIFRETQKHFEACGIQTHKDGTGYRLEPNPEKPGKFMRVPTGKRAVVEVGFHSLRHTFVSLQAERGTPQSTVQAIVGHGSPAMTQHYTHVTNEAAQQAAKALDSGIIDAEFEVVHEVPDWIKTELEKMTPENWKSVRSKILNGSPK